MPLSMASSPAAVKGAVSGRMSRTGPPMAWQERQSRLYSSRPASLRFSSLISRWRTQRAEPSTPVCCSRCSSSGRIEVEYITSRMM